MSIKMLAVDLYRATQQVEKLEKRLAAANAAEQSQLKTELTLAQKELKILRKMMDGEKETGTSRNKYATRTKFR